MTFLSREAVAYAIEQLSRIGGVDKPTLAANGATDESVKNFLSYSADDAGITRRTRVVVIPCQESDWRSLIARPVNSLRWLPTRDVLPPGFRSPAFQEELTPVLLWGAGCGDGSKPFAERRDNGSVIFYADIVAATVFMLSRWEEVVVPTRDDHSRFPATACVAFKQDFLDRPIVDEYALILQAWLKTVLASWTPHTPSQFTIRLTHDVDTLRSATWRRLAGDVLLRRSPSRALEGAKGLLRIEQDVFLRGVYELAELSEQSGLRSAFYFMTADRSRRDSGYDITSRAVTRLVNDLRQRGHEVGFHAGYLTWENPARFLLEKERMDRAIGAARYGGRQHYLRFSTPGTWRLWESAGLSYDSTLGYADHEGFRCGTCHPFRPFDIEQDRRIDLLEIPLIVMDGTLKQYRRLTPLQGERRILALARRCQRVNGVFTLLWHNTSLMGKWDLWAPIYRRLVLRLAELA